MNKASGESTLDTRIVRRLGLAREGSGPRHLSAASGLVHRDGRFYVVADDENGLGLFDADSEAGGTLFPLFGGVLPTGHAERKAAKADFESLLMWPADSDAPFGALIALGSGSRPNRERGAFVTLGHDGLPVGTAEALDLQPLFAPLHERFADLNIEGAFVDGDDLCLLQRGHAGAPDSACIRFALNDVRRWRCGERRPPPVRAIVVLALGDLDGVPLSLTDGAGLGDGHWAFCAAAEDTSDSYLDGRCRGSVVGIVRDGVIIEMKRLSRQCKAEGMAVRETAAGRELLLVTDDDDRAAPALLLAAAWPWQPH